RIAIFFLAESDGSRAWAGMQLGVDNLQRSAGLDAAALGFVARDRIAETAAPDQVLALDPDARAEFAGIGGAILDRAIGRLEVEPTVAHVVGVAVSDRHVRGIALAHNAVALDIIWLLTLRGWRRLVHGIAQLDVLEHQVVADRHRDQLADILA